VKTNKIFSPTLASLLHLGATNLYLSHRDQPQLKEELGDYLPEDYDDPKQLPKPKVLGIVGPTFFLDNVHNMLEER
jgi:hypothetical protein